MSEAKQSLAWIFFEEKDETFIHKEIVFLEFFVLAFEIILKPLIILVSDPSPHRQQVGLSDYPVKRESDYTESVVSIFCSKLAWELMTDCFYELFYKILIARSAKPPINKGSHCSIKICLK